MHTSLHCAVRNGTDESFAILLSQKDINVNAQYYENFAPVHYAVMYNEVECIKLLLSAKNIDVTFQNNCDHTPFTLAQILEIVDSPLNI